MRLIAFMFLLPVLAQAHDARLLNMGSDVHTLVDATRGKPFAEQLAGWSAFEAKYQDIYDEAVYLKRDRPDREKKRLAQIKAFFANLPSMERPMLDMFDRADGITESQLQRFRRVFPDLKPGTPIVFLPGLTFNGRVATLSRYGQNALLMAPDMVASRHDDVNILFSHEFFHVYHLDRIKEEVAHANSMASPLWIEGFGTYASELLNPGATANEVMMDPELGQECRKAENLMAWSKEFLQFYPKEDWIDQEADAIYGDWFKAGGKVHPYRRGYCLGYQVIKSAVRTIPIQELVNWNADRFFALVGEKLHELAGE